MDLRTLAYLEVGASFVLYIGIAFWTRASSTKGFYVAGGGVHPVLNGMATAAVCLIICSVTYVIAHMKGVRVAFVVSQVTVAPPLSVQQLMEDIRTPDHAPVAHDLEPLLRVFDWY